MLVENPKTEIPVVVYENGKPTGKTEKIDLSVPENRDKLETSLQQQDGEFD